MRSAALGGAAAAALLLLVSGSARAQAPAPPPPGPDAEGEIVAKPEAPPAPPPAPPSPSPANAAEAPAPAADRAELDALRARVAALEARAAAPPPPPPETGSVVRALTDPFTLTGYMQSQFETHQDSEDQLRQGGVPLNQDRFLVRRMRLRVDGSWEWAATAIEIDANTTHGPAVGLRKGEASLRWRSKGEPERTFVQATLGLFDTPFGYELWESPRTRAFMERSLASRSMYPGEPDLGLRLTGGVAFVRWTAAILNGHPLDEKAYPGQDPVAAKDVLFRLGVDTSPRPELRITGGVSGLRGKGFHAGTDATKATIEWRDANEDGVVQATELTPIPGQAATPSLTFDHWLVGADLQVRYESRLGKTLAYGEVALGNNMDRALYVGDPVANGTDARELGWYVGFVHELPRWGLFGFRVDYYDPNADLFDKRGGKLLPLSQRVITYSPLVGVAVPHAKLLFQYDFIDDFFARSAQGVPVDLKNDTATLRLQVEL